MTQVKTPAVAGLFYPDDPAELRETVARLLAAAPPPVSSGRPLALIAPHAGYQYSGPVAATAYAALGRWAGDIARVVVLAPSHRVPFNGIAASSADVFATPLGELAVDTDAVTELAKDPAVHTFDAAFAQEHALEVQLPFLQTVLGRFSLVPLVVGQADAQDVARVIEQLWRADTLIVVSSDLSHFEDYTSCQRHDQATVAAIEAMEGWRIGPRDACGAFPIRGLLTCASRHGWRVLTLDVRNSGDTCGDRSRVVGYGAFELLA